MNNDKIDIIHEMALHHGKFSDRAYLLAVKPKYSEGIIKIMETLAESKGYTKIIAKVPEKCKEVFLANNYIEEAHIDHLFNGMENGYFMVKYLDYRREIRYNLRKINRVLEKAISKMNSCEDDIIDNEDFNIEILGKNDAEEIADFYKKIFKSYPFPIFDYEYILKTMHENVDYYGIKNDGKIIGMSSIEIDEENSYAELTDFAVSKEFRNKGLAQFLLKEMEKGLLKKGIKTGFTIARAMSYGMNITFAKNGYVYGGTLFNNTNIAGNIESMNIWFKQIS